MSQEHEIERDFKNYEDRITRLKRVNKQLRNLGNSQWTTQHSEEIAAIEAKLKNPRVVDEAERLLISLQDRLKQDYEDWIKRCERVKGELRNFGTPKWREQTRKGIAAIEAMLKNPQAIGEAERLLDGLKEDYEDWNRRCERVEEELRNFDNPRWREEYSEEITDIEAMLKNPHGINEAERLLTVLKDQYNKDYEEWMRRRNRVKEQLVNLGTSEWRTQHSTEIADIDTILKGPHTIDEAERLLALLRDQYNKAYENWVRRCNRIKEELANLGTSEWRAQHSKEISDIEAVLKELHRVTEAENLKASLQDQYNIDYEDWTERCNRVKEQMANLGTSEWRTQHNKELADIGAILKEPYKVTEAEYLLALLQDRLQKEPKPIPYFPQELLAHYNSVEFIAKGGFARVYKARRHRDQMQVAVKIPVEMTPAVGRSFMAEIENWRKLDHDNIAKLLEFNILPTVYLEMEFCNGSLAKIATPLMVERAAFIIMEISRGLSHAHKNKIFHTDLKPSNILLLDDVPKITDWGLSKVQSEDGRNLAGSFSPQYAAPEQYSPEIFGKEDERTDIFQLGTMFYLLVTGKLPFSGDNLIEIKSAIIAESPKPPSEINPEAADVEPFILKCLQKKKADRYQDLSEFQDDLANFLGFDFEKSMTLSRNKVEQLKLCSDLIEVYARHADPQKCLMYLNNLYAYAINKQLKEMIQEVIETLGFYLSKNVDCKEIIPRLEEVIHRARMGG